MRIILAALVIAIPVAAHAEAPTHKEWPKLGVFQNRVKQRAPGVVPLANVSHVLYLNDCKQGRCVVSPGSDDSRTNRSSIPEQQVTLNAWSYSDAKWNKLVECARSTFAPFQIEITTVDPGSASHFEVMVGGRSAQLLAGLEAGGVAPFIDCATAENNVISFVFSEEVSDDEFLCGAIAQEASHVWGLDHSMNAKDPMTYLQLGNLKVFQNANSPCGEDQNRTCFCGGQTQNSVTFLNNRFGPTVLEPASVEITSPREGEWVKPGFPVHATLTSQLGLTSGALEIDGEQASTTTSDPLVFNLPTNLAGGDHTITVNATDDGARTVTDSVTVHVTAACSSAAPCGSGLHCLGGFCLPGANEAGGLGAECTANEQCITNVCASDGTDQLCAGPCDAGDSCPSGFTCIGNSGGGGTCWPGEDGGCATTDTNPTGFLLLGFGAIVLAVRRRRR
jgi:hypothetical protein